MRWLRAMAYGCIRGMNWNTTRRQSTAFILARLIIVPRALDIHLEASFRL